MSSYINNLNAFNNENILNRGRNEKAYVNMNKNKKYVESQNNGIEKHTVHWFRKGLRLHDNPALCEGLKESTTFRCVFVIDPWFAGSSNVGINKWR